MAAISKTTAVRILRLCRERSNVMAAWDNAGYLELERLGRIVGEPLYLSTGTLSRSRVYRITPAGLAWLGDQA